MKPSTGDVPSIMPTTTHTGPAFGSMSGAGTSATSGKNSSSTNQFKKKQIDKLQQVKRRTIGAAIIVDLILVGALIYQLVSLNQSLTGFLRTKTTNTLAFYDFQYNELFDVAELGQTVYLNNSGACRALIHSDTAAAADLRRRFLYDRIWRTNEILAMVDNNAAVVSSSGPESARGLNFDVGGLVSLYMQHYAVSGKSLRASVMVDQAYYTMFQAPILDAVGDYRPDLVSWDKQAQTLARVTLTPVYCDQAQPQGFLINVDSITPRQYDYFGTMLLSAKSAMGGVLAQNTDTAVWQTAFSYNQPGPYGATTRFPDMAKDIFPSAVELDAAIAAGSESVVTGTFTYENVRYQYAMKAVRPLALGGDDLQYDQTATKVVYLYAEPQSPIRSAVHTAMTWQIPWIVILLIWSTISSRFVLRKFVYPMQKLIESVKKKKMKEFNDLLRQMKANRSALWQVLVKVMITEAVLVGLIFANNNLLDTVAPDFTSAATEGRVLTYVITSRSINLLYYLAAWSTQSAVVAATFLRTDAAALLSDTLTSQAQSLSVDAICVIGLDSQIIASSYAPAVGNAFPESGLIEYLASQPRGLAQAPFTTHAAWSPAALNATSSGALHGPAGAPGLVRMNVAPIRNVTYDSSTDALVYGDLLGAVVIVRFINGADSIWIVDYFTPGYFGLHLWDRYHQKFVALTSVMKESSGRMRWGYDISTENPDLLPSGLIAMYNTDHLSIQNGVTISGKPYTASIVPFGRPDEVVLSPSVVNAYVVRGLSKTAWNVVRYEQLGLEIINMVLVVLIAVVKVVLAWLPLRRFLNALERAFTVSSVSEDRAAKRDQAIASLMEVGQAHATPSRMSIPPAYALNKPI